MSLSQLWGHRERIERKESTVGTTASFPLPSVLVAAEAAPLLLLPATLLLLLSPSFAALEPNTPPRTAPRMTANRTRAPTTQGHFFRFPPAALPYTLRMRVLSASVRGRGVIGSCSNNSITLHRPTQPKTCKWWRLLPLYPLYTRSRVKRIE